LQIDNKEKTKKADGFSTRETTQTRIRSFLRSVHFRYIIIPSVVLSAIAFASTISPNSWVVSDADHFYFEIFAVILSTIVAFYCITRAYTLNEKFSLFVGIGFSTIAIIDFLHAVFSYIAVGNTEFLSYFIPQTWFAGRTFLGAMLVIAVAKYAPKVEKKKSPMASIFPITTMIMISRGVMSNMARGNYIAAFYFLYSCLHFWQ
jgi:hypothetical protein